MLADFREHLLHQNKLIGDEREIPRKFIRAAISLDVENRARKAEKIAKHGIIHREDLFQILLRFGRFQQNTLLDDFIGGGGRQGQTGLESRLNAGEFIFAGFDNFVDGFLSGADHPHLALAFAADFLDQRLQIDEQVGVAADILPDLVDHKQQSEVVGLGIDVFLDFQNKLRDGGFDRFGAVEPVLRRAFAHAENLPQRCHNIVLKESESVAGFQPRSAVDFLEHTAEFLGLALSGDELLQLGNL